MKKMSRLIRVMSVVLCAVMLLTGTACDKDGNSDNGDITDTQTTIGQIIETNPPADNTQKEPVDDGRLRILITSDVHYTYQEIWYAVHQDVRMQHWVDSILAEHAKNPFDLIVIAGDTSLDHWATKGSWTKDGKSCTKDFVEKYVSQLPEGVPVFILPGNHEQYSNEKWLEITGNERQGAVVVGDNLFLMLDNFRETLDPNYGTYSAPDSVVDTDYVNEMMAKYPEHNVWLIAHWFQMSIQTVEFQKILRNDRVKGLFVGHSHVTTYQTLGAGYGNKIIATCGNFSYSGDATTAEKLQASFWGFRELIIDPNFAISNYIVVQTDIEIGNASIHVPYQKNSTVRFYYNR